jgi:hypothetical protein
MKNEDGSRSLHLLEYDAGRYSSLRWPTKM